MPSLLDPQDDDSYNVAGSGLLNVPAAPAGSMFDTSPQNADGLVAPGNINIHQRPVVRNADGSISTVRSMTFTNPDGSAVLVPSVIAGRGIVSPQEAYRYYKQTGQHLGIFDTPEAADAYAQSLHEQQAREYVPR